MIYLQFNFGVPFSDINECASNPCRNEVTCTDGMNRYSCSCVAGFTRDNCETGVAYVLIITKINACINIFL